MLCPPVDDLFLLDHLFHRLFQRQDIACAFATESRVPRHRASERTCDAQRSNLAGKFGRFFLDGGILELFQVARGSEG